LGLLLHAIVHSAGVQDREGGLLLLSSMRKQFPLLAKLFADGAYAGPIFHDGLAAILPQLEIEIVKRSPRAGGDDVKGFVVLPKRWIVERTLAWLNRCRRLAKDWENKTRNALAFLTLASIRLMLRKLCNPL
jgi:putative transposase